MWEIYAYHNSEQLAGVFNAIVALLGGDSYTQSFAIVVFLGFVAAMVAYMFQPEKMQGWKWLATVVLVFTVLLVPRVTVGIVDKTGGSAVRVVGNVPYGLALLGGVTSGIGNALTEAFETVFQVIPGRGALPQELLYQQNGMMFGSRLLQATRKMSLPDPEVRTDLINFVNNCTAFDIADGSLAASTFSTTNNLWAAMANTNPARFTPLHTPSGVLARPCTEAYSSIDSRFPAQIDRISQFLGKQMHPALPDLAAQAAITAQIPQAYVRSQIADAAQTAADLIRQNALINAVQDAAQLGCQKMSDPACMMMATGRATATASQNATWINGAKISEQALPLIRNAAEALVYAVFPLVVLMLLLTTGKTTMTVLVSYLIAAISIQLWPPLFAVLNYMSSIATQAQQAAAASIGPGLSALSLATSDAIYGNAISAQAVVSYLIIGIPMIAYALARGMQGFGTAMVGGLAGFQSIVGSHSASAALGNSSLASVSMDQIALSPRRSHSEVSSLQASSGDWYTFDGTGRKAVDMLKNSAPTGLRVSANVSEAQVEQASSATRAAHAEVAADQRAYQSSLTELFKRGTQSGSTFSDRLGAIRGSTSDETTDFGRMGSEIKRISDQLGVAHDQVFNTIMGASVSGKIFGTGAGASIDKNYRAAASATDKLILDAAAGEQLSRMDRWAKRVGTEGGIVSTLMSGNAEERSLGASLSTTRTRLDSSQRSLENAESYENSVRHAYENGISLSNEMFQDPGRTRELEVLIQVARDAGPNPQSVVAAYGAIVGNFQDTPLRHRYGNYTPQGAGDVAARQEAELGVLPGRNTIGRQHGSNLAEVGGRGGTSRTHDSRVIEATGAIERQHARDADAVTGKIEQQEAKIKEQSKAMGVNRREDGSIEVNRSLMKDSSKNMGLDVATGARQMGDLVTEVFQELKGAVPNDQPEPSGDEARHAQDARDARERALREANARRHGQR